MSEMAAVWDWSPKNHNLGCVDIIDIKRLFLIALIAAVNF